MRGGAEPEPLTQEEQHLELAVNIAKLYISHNRTIRSDKLDSTLGRAGLRIGRIFYVKGGHLTDAQCSDIMKKIEGKEGSIEEDMKVLEELEGYQSSYYIQVASTKFPKPTPPEKPSTGEDDELIWNHKIDWNRWAIEILSTEVGDRKVQQTTTSKLTLTRAESSLFAKLLSYTIKLRDNIISGLEESVSQVIGGFAGPGGY